MTLMQPAVSLDKRVYAPMKIAAVVATLADDSVSVDRVLQGTGLSASMLGDAATRTSMRQFVQVCQNARTLSSDPALGFRIGVRQHVSTYGLYGLALLCMTSLRHAIEFGMRYRTVTGPVMPVAWRVEGPALVWVYNPASALQDLDVAPTMHRFMLEMLAANHATILADMMGADCRPERWRVAGAPPPHAHVYERWLQCPVEFGQRGDEMGYAAAWLDRAPQLANPIVAAELLKSCTALLAEQRRASGVAAQVHRALTEQPGRFPDVESVAGRLHLSSRTLRRKLDAEGTSYQQLLAEVRCSLAIDYLRGTAMSTEDIAEALGFSDAPGFRHAFRRWTMKSPSEYRQA